MRLRKRAPRVPLTIEAFGVHIVLRVSDPRLEQAVRGILPPGWRTSEAPEDAAQFTLTELEDASYEVTFGDHALLEHQPLDVALELLDAEIQGLIAVNARDWVFVQAGVVVHAGRALVIPGASFSGKTTLVAALVRAGASFYSDEYAVFDRSGRLHPYARQPLGGGAAGRPALQEGGEPGAPGSDPQGAKLGVVIDTRYVPGTAYQPAVGTVGAGVLSMLTHAAAASTRPQEYMAVLTRAVGGSTVLVGDRGDAEAAATILLEANTAPPAEA